MLVKPITKLVGTLKTPPFYGQFSTNRPVFKGAPKPHYVEEEPTEDIFVYEYPPLGTIVTFK